MIVHPRPPAHELGEAPGSGRVTNSSGPVSPAVEPSVLDRRFDLSRISGESLAWVAVRLVAVLMRIAGLTNWPLSAGEAGIASDALSLLQGGALSTDAAAHPLPVALVALGLFLFGASDTVVRLIPATMGIGSILLLLPARSWLGRGPALGAAFVIALSPTLVFASRRVDAGSWIVFGSLLLLVMLTRTTARPGFGPAFAAGAVAALLPLASPLGWMALPLALVIAPAVTGRWLPRMGAIPAAVLGFLAAVIVVSTSLFTRPEGFAGFVTGSLSDLWLSNLSTAGAGWFLIPVELVMYELLALMFGVYAAYLILWNSGRLTVASERLARAVAVWALLAGGVALLVGEKAPELYSLVLLPLVLLAGIALSAAAGAVEWRIFRHGRGVWFSVALTLTIVAASSAFGLLLRDTEIGTVPWGVTLLMVVVLILGPLAMITLSMARGMNGRAGPIVMLALAILLGAYGLRSSLLLAATNLDRPGELLLVGSTAPDAGLVVERLKRLSLDLTATKADLRDPTGGHGLTIAVDRSIAQPFLWYLRAFPNVSVVAADTPSAEPVGYQVVISRPDAGPELVPRNAGYVERSYALTVPGEPSFNQPPPLTSLAEALVNPRVLKRYVDFLFDRQLAASAVPSQFDLALRSELAARVYETTAPPP
jgi:4-amino-4-deoxy-L-arabinose transferase-like glycosyltransferase